MAKRSGIFLLVILAIGLLHGTASGKSSVLYGGSPAIGLSSDETVTSIDRPVTPVTSILLDHMNPCGISFYSEMSLLTVDTPEENTVILKIAPGITWSDSPSRLLTAEDVVSSWGSMVNARWDASWALRGVVERESETGTVPTIDIIDDHTIKIELKPGYSVEDFIISLRSPALRLTMGRSGGGLDGTGPFMQEVQSPTRMRLTGSLSHFYGRPFADEISVISYPSSDESVLDFGRGSLDGLIITSSESDAYEGSSRSVPGSMESIGQGMVVLVINPLRVPNVDERRALAMSVDITGIADVVLGQGATGISDFNGTPAAGVQETINAGRNLYSSLAGHKPSLTLYVCDDPAAEAVAGRLRANWESLEVPVEISYRTGPLYMSSDADAMLLALRVIPGNEGILPQLLSLVDRAGMWEVCSSAMGPGPGAHLRDVRSGLITADLDDVGEALIESGIATPLANYDIYFAPGPGISLVPDEVYPGPVLWRAFMGTLPVRRENTQSTADGEQIE